MEQTREIEGYEGLYCVSDRGNVYSVKSGCLVTPQRGAYVTLSKNSKATTWRIADLVAKTWVKNVAGLPYVRHKDGIPTHNSARNLEWSIMKDRYLKKSMRRVLQLDMMGGLIRKYNSISDASYMTGVDKASISKCCNEVILNAGGFIWKFEK